MPDTDSRQVLADEIEEDARSRAERTLGRAREEADKALAHAKEQSEAESKSVLDEANARAETRSAMILSSVDHEVARRKAQARDQIISDAEQRAIDALPQLSAPEYAESLAALAADAVGHMPADAFVVTASERPGETLDPDALQGRIAALLDRDVTLRVDVRQDAPAGVVVASADGRLLWDNTYEARMRRLQAAVRRTAASVLFEKP